MIRPILFLALAVLPLSALSSSFAGTTAGSAAGASSHSSSSSSGDDKVVLDARDDAAAFVARHVQHHLALVQHHGAVAHVERLAHAVRDHHGGQLAFGHDARRQLQHEVGGARVERGGVLVQQQDARRLQRRHQ